MAITKQLVPISFGQGLDTKTDPRQVIPGKLLSAQNVVFPTALQFSKRNGYIDLVNVPSSTGLSLSTFKNELIAMDGQSLYSYVPSSQIMTNKGAMPAVEIT